MFHLSTIGTDHRGHKTDPAVHISTMLSSAIDLFNWTCVPTGGLFQNRYAVNEM